MNWIINRAVINTSSVAIKWFGVCIGLIFIRVYPIYDIREIFSLFCNQLMDNSELEISPSIIAFIELKPEHY